MTQQSDDGVRRSANEIPPYDELIELKALGQRKMDELRGIWRSKQDAMTASEREVAETRIRLSFEKIAAEFGKSRHLILKRNSERGE